MTKRMEQLQTDVAAAFDALLPHLPPDVTDEDAVRVFKAKHPELARQFCLVKAIEEVWMEVERLADLLEPLVKSGLEGDALLAAVLRRQPSITLADLMTPVIPAPRQPDDPPEVKRRIRKYDGLDEVLAAVRRYADEEDSQLVIDVLRGGITQGDGRCAEIVAAVEAA